MNTKEQFVKIIRDNITSFVSGDVKTYLVEKLKHYNICADDTERNNIVDEVSLVIDGVSQKLEDLWNANKVGTDRTYWLKKQFDSLRVKDGSPDEIVQCLSDNLVESNKKLGCVTNTEKIYFDSDFEKYAAAKTIEDVIETNVKYSICSAEDIVPSGNLGKDVVESYFEHELYSDKMRNLKKIISVATYIAQKSNLLSKIFDITPEQIAIIVDRGVTTAKVIYDVARGNKQAQDAVEVLIDHAAATVVYIAQAKGEIVGEKIGGTIGAAIGGYFNPLNTSAGYTIGSIVGGFIGKTTAPQIARGANLLAGFAKNVIHSAPIFINKISPIFA